MSESIKYAYKWSYSQHPGLDILLQRQLGKGSTQCFPFNTELTWTMSCQLSTHTLECQLVLVCPFENDLVSV